jgi:hypothetical protein
MSGDRDNPDQEFVCQSDPRNDCVVPVSRPDAPIFSDVHIYCHGAGMDTRYTGSIQIGLFRGSPESHNIQTSVAVQKTDAVTFDLVAIATGTGEEPADSRAGPVVVK